MREKFLSMNTKKWVDLKKKYKLTVEDFIIIRRINDFMGGSKSITYSKGQDVYSWVHYETIQEDMSFIFDNVDQIKNRLKKITKHGLIERLNHKVSKKNLEKGETNFNKVGSFSLIKFSKELKELFDLDVDIDNTDQNDHEGKKYPKGSGRKYPKGEGRKYPNKEYLESNTKKEIPSLGVCVSLSKDQEKELQCDLQKQLKETMKLIPVSKAVAKIGLSPMVTASILVPLAKQHGKQAIINILKDIKAEGNINPIKDFKAIIISRI
ncbi:MAG: hypothetical protein WBG30_07695 [Psychrilyobacter sp.]|uniref:hypothetical protein n=1 Tax=Psychrilyobacter sp. TaxID=2586924 RepID=UPI003C75DFD0